LGRSLLAAPSENITLTSFIAAMRFYTILHRDTWRIEYLPSNPHDCLLMPLIEKIETHGGRVLYGARASQLRREGNQWQIQVEDARRGTKRSITAQNVILAVDPPAAEKILCESPDTQQQAGEIRFPTALRNATVRLWFDAEPRKGTPGGMFTGDFVIDNFFWLHRMQAEFMEWNQVTGGSVIETHFYASEDILNKSNELLIIEATKEVQTAFPELRGHFVHGSLRRNNATQTQFIVPTARSLHLDTPWEHVYACGDWTGYPSPVFWMERCVVTGIAAANRILVNEGRSDEVYDIIPPRQPELAARIIGGFVRIGRRILGPVIFGVARAIRGKSRV
ncbi:MAG TPA: FAD-dependent oxidoreductase, partial [Aggregatilineales bacterium]|nr:FAD-dependent oxidoreductase [Aggregatilineales bacterium]